MLIISSHLLIFIVLLLVIVNTDLMWCVLLLYQLLVWNLHSQQPILKLTEHTAAVKAIAWSPHHSGLLASGGGTADRCIRFWNTANGHQLNSVDTGSQVNNIFDKHIFTGVMLCTVFSKSEILFHKQIQCCVPMKTMLTHIMLLAGMQSSLE